MHTNSIKSGDPFNILDKKWHTAIMHGHPRCSHTLKHSHPLKPSSTLLSLIPIKPIFSHYLSCSSLPCLHSHHPSFPSHLKSVKPTLLSSLSFLCTCMESPTHSYPATSRMHEAPVVEEKKEHMGPPGRGCASAAVLWQLFQHGGVAAAAEGGWRRCQARGGGRAQAVKKMKFGLGFELGH